MSCDEVCRWIDALVDGELDPKNASEVEAHLEGCADCRRKYEARRAVSANVRRLDLAYAAPESLRLRIFEAVDAAAVEAAQAATPALAAGSASSNVTTLRAAPAAQSAGRAGDSPALAAGSASSNVTTLRAAPAAQQPRVPRGPSRWLMLAGWPVALAASAMLATVLLQQRSQDADDVVAAHVRSLLADHLNDVVSTSHHTVKPWFAGKIDFSPPVPDLSASGFELVGGRLDYLEHQPVAAVVYRKHGHIINVLASLPGHDTARLPQTARVQGYSLRSWHQAGLNMVAVSDIDPVELANLEQGYTAPQPATPEATGTP